MLRVKLSAVDALRARALRRATYPKLGNPPGCDVVEHIVHVPGGGREVDARHFAALTDVDTRWCALRLANLDDAMEQKAFLLNDVPLGTDYDSGETLDEWSQAFKLVVTLIAMLNPDGPLVQVWDPFPRNACGDPTAQLLTRQGLASTPQTAGAAGRFTAAQVSGIRGTISEMPPQVYTVFTLSPIHFPKWIIPPPSLCDLLFRTMGCVCILTCCNRPYAGTGTALQIRRRVAVPAAAFVPVWSRRAYVRGNNVGVG
jgi:hypothetical protein